MSRVGDENFQNVGWRTEAQAPTISQIEFAVQEFAKRLAKLDEVQEALEVEVSEEDLDDFWDEAHAFRQAFELIRELAAAAAARSGVKAESLSGQSSSRDSDVTNVKLPKLELPKFNGEVTQWQSWDQFSNLHRLNRPSRD